MKWSLFASVVVFALAGLFGFSAPACAQATRTWVSGVGDDANPCSRTAPCKTFAGAISKTAVAGEINCLDPGGFGALTITNSIMISCETGTAGVLVSGTNGITISALATADVYLKGLDFEGLNSSTDGVQINSAAHVTIANCVIRGFDTAGIAVTPSSGTVLVTVQNTLVADNVGSGSPLATGILNLPSGSGSIRMQITRSTVTANGADGVMANATGTTGGIEVSVSKSESSYNGGAGFVSKSTAAHALMTVDDSTAFDNAIGVQATGSGAISLISRAMIYANTTGASQTGAAILYTMQDNTFVGGTTAVSGALTSLSHR